MSDTNQPSGAPQNQSASAPTEGQQSTGDQVADLQQQAQNGTPVQQKEAQKMLKKLSIKYNGRESEEDLPFEIPDTPEATQWMRNNLQMAKMGHGKAQDYAQLEKDVVNFLDDLRKDPKKALSDPRIGVDVKDLARMVIEEEIENAKKSPEQLEKEKLESELKRLKDEREQEKQTAKQQELQRLQEQEFERYDALVSQALDKADLPKKPAVVRKMADYMLLGLENGIDVSPDDIAKIVEEELQEELQELIQIMSEDKVEKFIGKDTLSKIRKKNLAKSKSAPPSPVQSGVRDTGSSTKPKETGKVERKTIKQMFGV